MTTSGLGLRLGLGACWALAMAAAAQAGVRVLNDDASFPEGPIWHQGKLYYVEYGRNAVMTWDGKVNRVFSTDPGCGPSAVVPTAGGEFLTTCYDSNRIGRISAEGALLRSYTEDGAGHGFSGPNDFAPDAHGGIYFTASGDAGRTPVTDGKVFYLGANGAITQMATDLVNANGLALSKDGKILYVVETDANRLLRFDVAADHTLTGRRVFLNLDELTHHVVHIWPDGVKIDSQGRIYIGQSPREPKVPLAGVIFVVDAHGLLLRKLELPSLLVPNFAFSPDEETLYVMAVDEVDKPYRGKVFSISLR